jgi:tetratricopeptide (TPR) repeat protein
MAAPMAQVTIQQAFDLALQHHQAGRLQEAEAIYRRILAQQPANIDALHLLGVIAHQVGRNDDAVDLIQRAIALRPDFPQAHSNLGNALKDKGRLDDAIAAYRRALALDQNLPETHGNLGNVLKDMGRLDEAIAAYRQAIAQRPAHAAAHSNLGDALRRQGKLDEAIAACRHALDLNPDFPHAATNLGNALRDKGQLDDAIAAYRHAIALRPTYAEANLNLGNALRDQGQLDDAIAAYHRAIALRPGYAEAECNLGNALKDKGRLDDAIAAFGRALAIRPDYDDAQVGLGNALRENGQLDDSIAAYRRAIILNADNPQAHTNLGIALRDKGELPEAIAAFRRAIALKPDHAEVHVSLAMALLHCDMEAGWTEYEWRWKVRGCPLPYPRFANPVWDGSDLHGRTVLLYAEQGFGETIQCIRYAPLVARRGGRVIVEAQPELIRLLRQLPDMQGWTPRGDPLPPFDLHCPLMDLPRLFATTLDNIPPQPYDLRPDAKLVESWRYRLNLHEPGVKVALAWSGNPDFKEDRTRSITLDRLAPLAAVPSVTLYSVQKGPAAHQADRPPPGLHLVNLAGELHDFADTAAVMGLMDLVLTTDTSVAHLAGALARPTWMMLQFMPDWRWLSQRPDSPWYPTMRLFRQTSPGDWPGVIARVAQALAELRAG